MSAAATVDLADPRLVTAQRLALVQPFLAAVEDRLNEEITSEVRDVNAIAGHILSAGGKRVRPAVVALSAWAVSEEADPERLVSVAAAVELVHMATLLHDDVVDDTATRRGKTTANAVFGNGVSVLTGDFLLARAMRLLAIDGDLRIMRCISEVTIAMSEGEVMEIAASGRADLSKEEYYEILRKKTAAFVEGCCRCGAILAEAGEQTEEALAAYGRRLGMAFQIADDLLDFTGDPEATGKPVGSDLRDGRMTLPLLIGVQEASELDRERLLGAVGQPDLSDEEVRQIVSVLRQYGALELTREAAQAHADGAIRSIERLRESSSRDCLRALAEYVVTRNH